MRSPPLPLLLLAAGLGVLCRRGHADVTITTKAPITTLGATAPKTTSGSTKTSTSSPITLPAVPEKQTALSATISSPTPTPTPPLTSRSTAASVQKTTSKDGHATIPSASATLLPGASTAKPTSPAPAMTATRPTTTSTVTLQATNPASQLPRATGTTSPSDMSAKLTSNTAPAQKTSEPPTGKATTRSATSPGTTTTTPGSGAAGQSGVSATNRMTTVSSGGSVKQTTPQISQTATPNVTQPATNTKSVGTPGTTAHRSTGAVSRPASSRPAVSDITTATETHPPHHAPLPVDQGNRTWILNQTQLVCEDEIPSESQNVILTFSNPTPCDSLIKNSQEEPLLNIICKTVKPDFNWSRDHCLVRLASVTNSPNAVAVVGAHVQISSVADELFEALKTKEGELKKLGMNVSYAGQYVDMDSEDRFSMPLIITIVCMAASLLLVAAIYGCCHQRISQRKDQQRLTEELQTMENGYHDNPTLEVMETSSEMQEKKVNPNGELGDSWIVPLDNLTKEDLGEEEDTHL